MKKIVYLAAAVLSALTFTISALNGMRLEVILERSVVVFLSSLALVVLFTHLLSWGLKMTSVKEQEQKDLNQDKDPVTTDEQKHSEISATG